MDPIHIISLGAGVQSSTMALMAACGEITPMPTCAIFADTMAEPQIVYEWLDYLESKLPFPVYRVSKGSLAKAALTVRISKNGNSYTNSNVPAFLKTAGILREGKQMRQCTRDFKIDVILRKVREIGKEEIKEWRRDKSTAPPIIQWIGISRDEVIRMKPSRLPYIRHIWPLVEREMTREKCLSWMAHHAFPTPPRSACVFCPYHSDKEWLRLKKDEPQEFEKAARFEDDYQVSFSKIQRRQAVPFLHRSMLPLREVNFKASSKEKHPDLFGNECEGMCGV